MIEKLELNISGLLIDWLKTIFSDWIRISGLLMDRYWLLIDWYKLIDWNFMDPQIEYNIGLLILIFMDPQIEYEYQDYWIWISGLGFLIGWYWLLIDWYGFLIGCWYWLLRQIHDPRIGWRVQTLIEWTIVREYRNRERRVPLDCQMIASRTLFRRNQANAPGRSCCSGQ